MSHLYQCMAGHFVEWGAVGRINHPSSLETIQVRLRKVTWNSHLFVPFTPVPSEIISSICRYHVIWQSQQSDQSSSPSPAELTAMGIPWGTDTHKHSPSLLHRPWQGRAGKCCELAGAYWKQLWPCPPLHCVLTRMEQRSFFSSYLTGNSYLQHFLPDIFITPPRHSLQALT